MVVGPKLWAELHRVHGPSSSPGGLTLQPLLSVVQPWSHRLSGDMAEELT